MIGAEATLRALIEIDAARLATLVTGEWKVLPDPFGSPMLVPNGEDADPRPVEDLPWEEFLIAFRIVHGRPPRPGARALAARRLASPRRVGGGLRG